MKTILCLTLYFAMAIGAGYPKSNGYSYTPSSSKEADYGGGNGGGNGEGNGGGSDIPIIKYESNINPDGSYNYEYETGNGIQVQESGSLKDSGIEGHKVITAEGSFSYVSPEGQPIELTYVADEKGFQPQGAHLPTPPPIPPEIQAALDKITANGGHPGDNGNGDSGGYVY